MTVIDFLKIASFPLYFKGITDSNNYDRMTCDVNILLMAIVHAHVIWLKKRDTVYSAIHNVRFYTPFLAGDQTYFTIQGICP